MAFSIIETFYRNTLSIAKHLDIAVLKKFHDSPSTVNSHDDQKKGANDLLLFYKISKEYINKIVPKNNDLQNTLDLDYEKVLFCLDQDVHKTEILDLHFNTTREQVLQLNSIALLQEYCIVNPLSKITSLSLENKEYAQLISNVSTETDTVHTLSQLIHIHDGTPTSNLLEHIITPIEYEFITLFETKQRISDALQEVGFETTVHEGKLIDEDIETALHILRNCIYKKFIITPV